MNWWKHKARSFERITCGIQHEGSFERISDGIQNSQRNYQYTEVVRQDLLHKRGMGKQRWRRNYAFSNQRTNSFMEEQGKVQNRRTAVRLVRLYVQLFFYIGCCCASPVVWCKQKHICASLSRCVCSMVTFVLLGIMWTVPLVYRLYLANRHRSGFGIPDEPWWVI